MEALRDSKPDFYTGSLRTASFRIKRMLLQKLRQASIERRSTHKLQIPLKMNRLRASLKPFKTRPHFSSTSIRALERTWIRARSNGNFLSRLFRFFTLSEVASHQQLFCALAKTPQFDNWQKRYTLYARWLGVAQKLSSMKIGFPYGLIMSRFCYA